MKKGILGLVVLAGVAAASPANAVVIFSDTFNRETSNTVGNGWTEHEYNPQAVRVHFNNGFGSLSLRNQAATLPDASVLAGAFSTVGYTNITVTFLYRAADGGNESTDRLFFDWGLTSSTGTINPADGFLNQNTGVNDFVQATINLGALAANQASLYIRLFTNVDADSEGYLVRNFVLSGDLASNAPGDTPVPGAALLMGSVLAGGAGFGAWRRKRKQAA